MKKEVQLLQDVNPEVIAYGQVRGRKPFAKGEVAEVLCHDCGCYCLRVNNDVFWVSESAVGPVEPPKPALPNSDQALGMIYVRSWGYDQTNVDAYQVVRVTEKMMWLRPICLQDVKGSEGFMCNRVIPLKDHFCEGGRMVKVRRDGPDHIPGYIKFGSLWDGKRDFYCSWYA